MRTSTVVRVSSCVRCVRCVSVTVPVSLRCCAGTSISIGTHKLGVLLHWTPSDKVHAEGGRDVVLLPRKERDGAPKTQKTTHSTTHTPTTHGAPCTSDENKPNTPGQDDDPDRIDDVV